MSERTIYISGPVDFDPHKLMIADLLKYNLEDSEKPIHVFINTLGGSLDMALAMFDLFRASKAPVFTYNIGTAYSAGFLLFLGGVKRLTTINASFMLHPPHFATEEWSQPVDLKTRGNFGIEKHEQFIDIFVKESNISQKEAQKLTEKDSFFGVAQAQKYGIIDEIITQFPTDSMNSSK